MAAIKLFFAKLISNRMPKARILLVEDEFIVAANIKLCLEQHGYPVMAIVASGEEAISRALELEPDLILMDIKLQGSLDGIEAAQEIRQRQVTPIVFMTAYTDAETFERAKQTEPAGYMLKPFENRDLPSTIEMALYKHNMAQKLKHSEARYRRLFEQSAAMLADTEALYRFSLSLTTITSLADLLQDAVNSISHTLPAHRAALILVDLARQNITNIVTNVESTQYKPVTSFAQMMAGLSGWVIREKIPALSPKEQPDPRESQQVQQYRQYNQAGAVLVVPIIFRGTILGTLTAANNLDGPDFTQRDIKIMTAMANQTAVAIENARLVEQLKAGQIIQPNQEKQQ